MTGLILRSIVTAFGLSVLIVTVLAGVAQADPVVPGEEHCVVNVRPTTPLISSSLFMPVILFRATVTCDHSSLPTIRSTRFAGISTRTGDQGLLPIRND